MNPIKSWVIALALAASLVGPARSDSIEKKRAEDIPLQANDIVDVPISGTKSLLRSLIGGIAPAVTQLPVRVIP